jgi:hypothetical protein
MFGWGCALAESQAVQLQDKGMEDCMLASCSYHEDWTGFGREEIRSRQLLAAQKFRPGAFLAARKLYREFLCGACISTEFILAVPYGVAV